MHAKVLIAALTGHGQAVLDRAYQEVNVLERAFADTFTPQTAALCATSWNARPQS